MRILTPFTYDKELDGTMHQNSGQLMTVPEDTLSMRDIYNRFRNGEPLDVNLYDPLYSDNEYQDIDLSVLDPVEVMELTQKYNDIRKKHEENIEKQKELEEFQQRFKDIVKQNNE